MLATFSRLTCTSIVGPETRRQARGGSNQSGSRIRQNAGLLPRPRILANAANPLPTALCDLAQRDSHHVLDNMRFGAIIGLLKI